jgi:hypothetical protein
MMLQQENQSRSEARNDRQKLGHMVVIKLDAFRKRTTAAVFAVRIVTVSAAARSRHDDVSWLVPLLSGQSQTFRTDAVALWR